MNVAFFGTGMMGSGFVRRLLANGNAVRVWNRDPAKAAALEAEGATVCAQPSDALTGAEQVHLSLSDDASVDAVLEPLAGDVTPQMWIVDHTTTAPAPTLERIARWTSRGKRYVPAPVFMGPKDALEGTGVMLISGPKAAYDALAPSLQKMTGKLIYLGEDPGRSASVKLLGNLSLVALTAVIGDMNRFGRACGLSTAEAMSFFKIANPGATMPARAEAVAEGAFDAPTFALSMARKDVGLILDEAKRHGVELCVMPGVARMFDEAIARGDGDRSINAAARI